MTHDPGMDRWLRETLDSAVNEVEPAAALGAIRARTTGPARGPGWRWAAGGVAAGVAATLVTIALLPTSGPTRTAPGPAGPPTATAPAMRAAPVYYVGDTPFGPRLYREFQQVPATGKLAVHALRRAIGGTPLDPDYRSPWASGWEIRDVSSTPSLITVDLGGPPDGAGPTAFRDPLAVQQVIYTAQGALQSTNQVPVRMRLNGEQVSSIAGVDVSEPLLPQPALQVLSTVWITSPQEGDTVESSTTVTGRGAFPEANVSWQLLEEDGDVVDEGFTTAEECCRLAPYELTLEARPGTYVLRVYAADQSGGEAPGEVEDTKTIIIESPTGNTEQGE